MAAHGCHTAILYGSHARGDATPQSDVDVLCVREGGAPLRDVRQVEGPSPLADDERQAPVVWAQKMIDRVKQQFGAESDYRRMTLVVRALEDYFLLRNKWFRGEKAAFRWLRQHDETAFRAFERVGVAGARHVDLAELVHAVNGRTSAP